MTNAELLQLVKYYTRNDDGSDLYYDDTEYYIYLNLAQIKVAIELARKDLGYFEEDATINFVDGTQEYALETDILLGKVRGIEWVDSIGNFTKCNEIKKEQRYIRDNAASSNDYSDVKPDFYITGIKIGFSPKPTYARTPAIRYVYLQKPTAITAGSSGDTNELPECLHELIALEAVMRARGIKDDDGSQELVSVINDVRKTAFSALTDRTIANATTIQDGDPESDLGI